MALGGFLLYRRGYRGECDLSTRRTYLPSSQLVLSSFLHRYARLRLTTAGLRRANPRLRAADVLVEHIIVGGDSQICMAGMHTSAVLIVHIYRVGLMIR